MGVEIPAITFVVLTPVAIIICSWGLFNLLGKLFEKIVFIFEYFDLPRFDFDFDEKVHKAGKRLGQVSEIVRKWFIGSIGDDVIYITLSLSILVAGVLLS